ncbi:MAG: PaaI family thioesterase [Gammaproteobacteria bacterium]|nr:PaaI family thioesterase [Gammaproteobacteria bacterium]
MATHEKTIRAFIPEDQNYEQRVRQSFARQGIMAHIGAELGRVEPGYCEIRLPFNDTLTQQHGYFHGGITTTIADSACGYAGFTLMPADASVLTIEYKVNFLAPADGELLLACGHVVKPGKTIIVCQSEVTAFKGDKQRVCASMTETMMVMRGLAERA